MCISIYVCVHVSACVLHRMCLCCVDDDDGGVVSDE